MLRGGESDIRSDDLDLAKGPGVGASSPDALVRRAVKDFSTALGAVKDPKVALELSQAYSGLLGILKGLLAENTELREGDQAVHEEVRATRERLRRALENLAILQKIATYDGLTGLLNKNTFGEYMPKYFEKHKNEGVNFAFLMMDGDGFKRVNDEHGHDAGDYVLRELGAIAKECFRVGDFGFRGGSEGGYNDTDGIGVRFGGDEFCFVLADTDAEKAAIAAERFRKMVADHEFIYEGKNLNVGVSIGLDIVDYENDEGWEAVAKRADKALYQAKHEGKGKVCIFSADKKRPE